MKTYRALKAFAHENTYCAAGAEVQLTDKQAKFLETGGFVEPVPAPAEAVAEPVAETKKAGAK